MASPRSKRAGPEDRESAGSTKETFQGTFRAHRRLLTGRGTLSDRRHTPEVDGEGYPERGEKHGGIHMRHQETEDRRGGDRSVGHDRRAPTSVRRSDNDPARPRVPLAPDPTVRRLSPREREIALLLADGLGIPSIAQRLGLSTSTVSGYLRRIQLRLDLDRREEIVSWVKLRRSADPEDPRLHRPQAP